MTVRKITIRTGAGQLVNLYPEGGADVETHVKGIGWVLDNDIPEEVFRAAVLDALAIVQHAADYATA